MPFPTNELDLTFHENFEGHQVAMGRPVVTIEEALEAWYGGFSVRRNRSGRIAAFLATGWTASGRLVTLAVAWRDKAEDWRAYNAWDTKVSDW